MTVDLAQMSPRRAREEVRQQTFPNTDIERRVVWAVDQAAFDRIRTHERLLVEDAAQRITASNDRARAADEITGAIVDDLLVPLNKGARLEDSMSARFQDLEFDAHKAINDLLVMADHLDLLANRLEDPESDYERLISRFPALRRPLQF